MAEREQGHRHKLLDKGQQEGSKVRNFGFIIRLVSLLGGLYLIANGKMVAIAYPLILAPVAEIIFALVYTWTQKIRGKGKTGQA